MSKSDSSMALELISKFYSSLASKWVSDTDSSMASMLMSETDNSIVSELMSKTYSSMASELMSETDNSIASELMSKTYISMASSCWVLYKLKTVRLKLMFHQSWLVRLTDWLLFFNSSILVN